MFCLRGVCGCISLADVNNKAESRMVIKKFFLHIVLSCDPLHHFIVLFLCMNTLLPTLRLWKTFRLLLSAS